MLSPRDRGATALHPLAPPAGRLRAIWVAQWGTGGVFLLLGTLAVGWGYAHEAVGRFTIGFLAAWLAQGAFIAFIRRRSGQEASSLADWLTLGRAAAGSLLAGLVASGVHDRLGLAGWLGCGAVLVAGTALDWLDGPLARRLGPTHLGAALDIEADSWLTLWSG
ncbi:MAG: CDP-alcohol phosphatidyltransferase family protein, partial [Ktedonobacterales bacterium]|nr:CDP-alcohol phosphatidyltransferase family protein [Ktedonobacterales bacterium]